MRERSLLTQAGVLAICALVSVLLPSAFAPAAVETGGLPQGFLRVQGKAIVDARGNPVLLRGVNMHTDYYKYHGDPDAPRRYATQADINSLAAMGATVIRLAFHWRYFDTALGFELIDTYLNWCEQAGVYVILDMHVVPPDEDLLEGKIWNDPAGQQRLLDLWRAIAARYAQRHVVAGYDLFNEPLPPNSEQWWALADRIRAAIRSVDQNHILFVENPLNEGRFRLLADPNVVYSYHDYTPFVVSHAGVDWIGDSPVPTTYFYPGRALVDLQWVGAAQEIQEFTGRSSTWVSWESGPATVPARANFAGPILYVWGNSGAVWFDDLSLLHNGRVWEVLNGGFERESLLRVGMPANWYFWGDEGVHGSWSNAVARSGQRSLQIRSTRAGVYGEWSQANWIMTQPLVPVQQGDTLRVRGWLRAPDNDGGGAGLGLNYWAGVYVDYNRDQLLTDIKPYLEWAEARGVPLFVGEFGAIATAPGDSRYHLVEDKIALMNATGLHWALWVYREDGPGFGVYEGDRADERLLAILAQGLASR